MVKVQWSGCYSRKYGNFFWWLL